MSRPNLKEVAYLAIRQRILDCDYEPNSLLNEEVLQNELGFSRTPIREALAKLENEGLIEIVPKKGIRVSNYTLSDLIYTYEIRLLIEPYNIRKYGKNLDRSKLLEMKTEHESLLKEISALPSKAAQEKIYKLDDAFHSALFLSCSNPNLLMMQNLVSAQSHRSRIMLGKIMNTRVNTTLTEHLSIIQSLIDSDYEAAAEKITQHLLKGQEASMTIIMSDPLTTRF